MLLLLAGFEQVEDFDHELSVVRVEPCEVLCLDAAVHSWLLNLEEAVELLKKLVIEEPHIDPVLDELWELVKEVLALLAPQSNILVLLPSVLEMSLNAVCEVR